MIDIITNFIPVLAFLTGLTALTTEAFKKIFDDTKYNYSKNLVTGVVAIVMTTLYCVAYVIINDVVITPKILCYSVILVFMSWLSSMVSYDKVKQLFSQLK